MHRKTLITLTIPLLFIVIGSQSTFGVEITKLNYGNTLYVGGNGSGNYSTIQSAIAASNNGDTIFVFEGTYYENVVITKLIIIIGENRDTTIIDGMGTQDKETVLIDQVDGINFSGFTIQNSGLNQELLAISTDVCFTIVNDCRFTKSSNGFIGIKVWHGDNNVISNCLFESSINGPAIQLFNGENNLIKSCTINERYIQQIGDNNGLKIIDCTIDNSSYDGIFVSASDDLLIENCAIHNSLTGILIERSGDNNKVINCKIRDNIQYGIYCDGDQTRIQIKDCYIADTQEIDGIIFWSSVSGTIINCTFENNPSSGITFWSGFSRCTIASNNFINNGIGIESFGNFHMLNNVNHNSFQNHNSEINFDDKPLVFGINIWSDNYWSDWSGIGPYHVFGLLNWDFQPRMTPLL